ncbi:uncharacterized protein LOC134312469 [Trichomycterus rosablanca]|uniref:uncharacterized protein LOC134312469 n=1 Tax=Trichomycterus rosablanca TaxID=2290929 RepID=UPI002F34FFB5
MAFLCTLEKQNRKSLEQTESLLTERGRLKACISNLNDRIEYTEKKKNEQIQIQKAISENRDKILKSENFTFTVTKCHKEKVPICDASWWDRKVTYCSVCQENCHEYNCWCAPTAKLCWVMRNDHCTVCTHKCHYAKHKKENIKYVNKHTDEVINYNSLKQLSENQDDAAAAAAAGIRFDLKVYENVKTDIESNKKREADMQRIEKTLQKALSDLENRRIKLVEEAYAIIQTLCDIALQPDSAYIIESLDFLIPRAEETGLYSCAQNLKELRKIDTESEGKTYAALRYMKGGVDKITSLFSRNK